MPAPKKELSKDQRTRLTEAATDAAEAHRQAAAKRKRAGTKGDQATAKEACSQKVWQAALKACAEPTAATVRPG